MTTHYETGLGDAKPDPPPEVMVGAFNMANGKDRQTMQAAITGEVRGAGGTIRRRWNTTQELRDEVLEKLRNAMRLAESNGDARNVKGCAATIAAIEKQNQDDEHLTAKQERPELHEHRHVVFNVPAPRVRGRA